MNITSHQKNLWLGQHHLHRVLNPQKDQLVDDKYVLYIQMYIRLDNFSGNSDKKSGKTCFCSEKFLNFRIAKQAIYSSSVYHVSGVDEGISRSGEQFLPSLVHQIVKSCCMCFGLKWRWRRIRLVYPRLRRIKFQKHAAGLEEVEMLYISNPFTLWNLSQR